MIELARAPALAAYPRTSEVEISFYRSAFRRLNLLRIPKHSHSSPASRAAAAVSPPAHSDASSPLDDVLEFNPEGRGDRASTRKTSLADDSFLSRTIWFDPFKLPIGILELGRLQRRIETGPISKPVFEPDGRTSLVSETPAETEAVRRVQDANLRLEPFNECLPWRQKRNTLRIEYGRPELRTEGKPPKPEQPLN